MAPRAGLQRNAGDGERGPAQLLACKKAAARPLARRAHANATRPQDTRIAASSRKIPDSCGRRERAARRTGGPAGAKKRRRSSRLAAHTADRRTGRRHTKPVERCTHASRENPARPLRLTRRAPPRSRRTRPSARSGRSPRRWPRTGPSPSGSACARATRSAGTRSGGTGAARSSACRELA